MGELQEKIGKEFVEFKKEVLGKGAEEIWEGCCKIYFYSSLYEYFTYNEKIPYFVVENLKECRNILAGCWELYLRKEELSILCWADIEIYWKYIQGKRDNIYENQRICRRNQTKNYRENRGCH